VINKTRQKYLATFSQLIRQGLPEETPASQVLHRISKLMMLLPIAEVSTNSYRFKIIFRESLNSTIIQYLQCAFLTSDKCVAHFHTRFMYVNRKFRLYKIVLYAQPVTKESFNHMIYSYLSFQPHIPLCQILIELSCASPITTQYLLERTTFSFQNPMIFSSNRFTVINGVIC
jgi:hypothetical protein